MKGLSKLQRYGVAAVSCRVALAAERLTNALSPCFLFPVALSSLFGRSGHDLFSNETNQPNVYAVKRTKVVIALWILLACCSPVSALDPSLDISQYAHTAWKIREGFSKGRITSIAQTPDGYLWLGTEFGLLRFDGVRNVLWDEAAGQRLPSRYIRNLLTARDGRLWIGTYQGLASWKDGKLTEYRELAGQTVDALVEDREGTIWAGGYVASIGKLCAIRSSSSPECYGDDGRLGLWVASLYEDSRGNLWAGAQTGLWRWKPGPPKLYPMPYSVIGTSSQTLNESDDGALLIATQDGIRKLADGNAEAYSLPGTGPRFQAARLLWDRNGGLWIGTPDRGLLHVHQGRTDGFTQSDGLSGDYINKLFEDREGNIWVATLNGLDRFRGFAVPTISMRQGLSNAIVWSVLGARDGSVWLGTPDGLNRWNNGQITIYRKRGARAGSGGTKQERELNVREMADGGLPDHGVESLFQDDGGRIWAFTEKEVQSEHVPHAGDGAMPKQCSAYLRDSGRCDPWDFAWARFRGMGFFYRQGHSSSFLGQTRIGSIPHGDLQHPEPCQPRHAGVRNRI
jgi:ligand-binding sensor domain-containing protein